MPTDPTETHSGPFAGPRHSRPYSMSSSIGRRPRIPSSLIILCLGVIVLAGCGSAQRRPAASASASAEHMVQLLESQLPRGKVSAQQGRWEQKEPGVNETFVSPTAQLVFDDGGETAMIAVELHRLPLPAPPQVTLCPDTAYHPYSRCSQTSLPGGAKLMLDDSPQDEDHPSGAKVRTAWLTYENGSQVSVSERANSGGTATGDTGSLPLSPTQLSSIAAATGWKPLFSAMPAPPAGPKTTAPPGSQFMAGQQIEHILQQLMPTGLQAGQPGGSDGFGHIVVNDGRGESLVAANVQWWKPDAPEMAAAFAKSDTLADGTRIIIGKSPAPGGGAGAVAWSVDTFRKDGLRVVISSVNAGAYQLAASRNEPALNIEQLKQIALNPAWQRAGAWPAGAHG
jgi:hypothetical protein